MEIFPHLSELELADTGGEADIDVLVGSDLYWSLVTGRIVRDENGPTAIETVFGWVLSGPVDSAPETFVLTSTLHTPCMLNRVHCSLITKLTLHLTRSCRHSGTWKFLASKTIRHQFMMNL